MGTNRPIIFAMTNHRHEPSSAFSLLPGSVSAPGASAHYCDRNANVTLWTQPESSSKQELPVKNAANARYPSLNPKYPQALHAAITQQMLEITMMKPLPQREIQENEGDDVREGWDERGEDYDAEWNRLQDYNDYLRDIEA